MAAGGGAAAATLYSEKNVTELLGLRVIHVRSQGPPCSLLAGGPRAVPEATRGLRIAETGTKLDRMAQRESGAN